jgi:hypothetical protein
MRHLGRGSPGTQWPARGTGCGTGARQGLEGRSHGRSIIGPWVPAKRRCPTRRRPAEARHRSLGRKPLENFHGNSETVGEFARASDHVVDLDRFGLVGRREVLSQSPPLLHEKFLSLSDATRLRGTRSSQNCYGGPQQEGPAAGRQPAEEIKGPGSLNCRPSTWKGHWRSRAEPGEGRGWPRRPGGYPGRPTSSEAYG